MKTELPHSINSLYLTASAPKFVLAITEYAPEKSKLVSLVRPAQLPLPFSFCRVDVESNTGGVDVRDPDTKKVLFHLDCDFDSFDKEWAGLLPIFSRTYLEGDTDAREFEKEQQ